MDPSLLAALGAQVGDSLSMGETRFHIIGTLVSVPGDVGIRSAFGPRVFVSGRYLEETGLVAFGSRAEYMAYLACAGSAEFTCDAQGDPQPEGCASTSLPFLACVVTEYDIEL